LFFASAIKNHPLVHFLSAYVLIGLGHGAFYGLVYLFVTVVLGLSEQFVWVLLVDAVVTLVAAPLWRPLMVMIEKHRALALGIGVSAMAIAALVFLPAGVSATPLLLVLIGVRAFGAAVVYVAPNALLGDIADYEWMRRGVNRAANCHALVSLLTKIGATVGGGGALLLAGWIGFDPQASNGSETLTAFRAIALAAPAVLLAGGAILAFKFPLGRREHDIVRRRIETRQEAVVNG